MVDFGDLAAKAQEAADKAQEIADKAQDVVDDRGGVESLEQDAQELRDIVASDEGVVNKAKEIRSRSIWRCDFQSPRRIQRL